MCRPPTAQGAVTLVRFCCSTDDPTFPQVPHGPVRSSSSKAVQRTRQLGRYIANLGRFPRCRDLARREDGNVYLGMAAFLGEGPMDGSESLLAGGRMSAKTFESDCPFTHELHDDQPA